MTNKSLFSLLKHKYRHDVQTLSLIEYISEEDLAVYCLKKTSHTN